MPDHCFGFMLKAEGDKTKLSLIAAQAVKSCKYRGAKKRPICFDAWHHTSWTILPS
jgi:hypothetical protein